MQSDIFDWLGPRIIGFVALHWGTASILEIVWSCACLVGLLIVAWLLRESLRDRDALLGQADYIPRGPRAIVAAENIRNDLWKCGVEAFFLMLGITGMLSPSAYRTPTPYAIILSVGATCLALLLATAAVLDFRDRRRFLDEIRKAVEAARRRNRRKDDQEGTQQIAREPVEPDLPYATGERYAYSRDIALRGEGTGDGPPTDSPNPPPHQTGDDV